MAQGVAEVVVRRAQHAMQGLIWRAAITGVCAWCCITGAAHSPGVLAAPRLTHHSLRASTLRCDRSPVCLKTAHTHTLICIMLLLLLLQVPWI